MSLSAWCGACGGAFPLAEVLQPGSVAGCPRCGRAFAPGYATVVAAAVRQVLAAEAALEDGLRQLADTAPALHIDRRRLAVPPEQP